MFVKMYHNFIGVLIFLGCKYYDNFTALELAGGNDGTKGSRIRGQGRQQEQVRGDLEILGRIRATPRWADDPMWRLDILGRRRATPK